MSLMTITTGLSLLPYLLFHTTPNDFCHGLEAALEQERSSSSQALIPVLDSRSVGVTGEGLYFPINSSLGLFASIAFVLALHSFILVYIGIERAERLRGVGKGEKYHVYLIDHQFTSPDAPVQDQDEIIPQRCTGSSIFVNISLFLLVSVCLCAPLGFSTDVTRTCAKRGAAGISQGSGGKRKASTIS